MTVHMPLQYDVVCLYWTQIHTQLTIYMIFDQTRTVNSNATVQSNNLQKDKPSQKSRQFLSKRERNPPICVETQPQRLFIFSIRQV
jgi:hypothetical protein